MIPSDLFYNIDSPSQACVGVCEKIVDSYNKNQRNFNDYLSSDLNLSKSELSSILSNLCIRSIKDDRKNVSIQFCD